MSTLSQKPRGILQSGWSSCVEDYAIAGRWSSDGEILVVGDAAGGVFGFQAKSGTVLWSHSGIHEGGVLSMATHPNHDLITTAGQDGKILFCDIKSGVIRQTIELGSEWIEYLEWSSDGRWLAASCSRRVHVYNIDGDEIWRSDHHPSTISAIAWLKSKELATACYGQVKFFKAASGQTTQILEWKGSLVSMVLSSDGDIVACGSQDNTVHFWRRSTTQDSMMAGYSGKPSVMAFDHTDTLLATGGGKSITVWSFHGNGPEGTRPGVLEFHRESITSLTFAPHGMMLASGSRGGSVALWVLKNDGEGHAVGAALLSSRVSGLVWHPSGASLAAFDAMGGVTVWQVDRIL